MSQPSLSSKWWQQYRANVSDIAARSEKDGKFIDKLIADINHVVRETLGTRQWIRYEPIIARTTHLVYHLLTTVAGNQTLGEEYYQLVQTNLPTSLVPSAVKRLALALVTCFGDIFLKRLHQLLPLEGNDGDGILQNVDELVSKANRILFFWGGKHFELEKRLLGIDYLTTRRRGDNNNNNNQEELRSRRLIVRFGLIELALMLYFQYVKYQQQTQPNVDHHGKIRTREAGDDQKDGQSSALCLLCQSTRTQPTALPCGHIFCWSCLIDWLEFKSECPLCKHPARADRMLFLCNYK